jgi:hypothetical protein
MAAPPGRFAQHLAALPVDAREHTADDVERALASPSWPASGAAVAGGGAAA